MSSSHFIRESLREFMGRPVRQYDPVEGLVDPRKYAWRLGFNNEDDVVFDAQVEALLADPDLPEIESLVIGPWSGEMFEDSGPTLREALLGASPRLTGLRGLFYGDITYESCEISWIRHSNLAPLVNTLPALEELVIRGGSGLRLSGLSSGTLRKLTLQAGGLSGDVVRDVVSANLPELEHLELWLGTRDYGSRSTVHDLQPLLSGKAFPKLTWLGLKNNEQADELAAAMATAPVTSMIKSLDMSMGTMGDEGGEALLRSPAIAALELLVVDENYLSTEMRERLTAHGTGTVLSRGERDDYGEDRYVSCGE